MNLIGEEFTMLQRRTVRFKGTAFPEYEVDTDGNVFRKGKENPLKPFDDLRGYNMVDLMINSDRVHAKVHLIVAHTFLGPQKSEMIVNHKDGDKKNNKLSNLEYISQKENVKHAQIYIRELPYLTDEQLKKIMEMKQEGHKIVDISRELDVHTWVVRDYIYGKTYH